MISFNDSYGDGSDLPTEAKKTNQNEKKNRKIFVICQSGRNGTWGGEQPNKIDPIRFTLIFINTSGI